MKPPMSSIVDTISSTLWDRASERRNQKISYTQMKTIAIEAMIRVLMGFTSIWIIHRTTVLVKRDNKSIQLEACLKCFSEKILINDQIDLTLQ